MKKEVLRKISKGAKVDFLNKLGSGKFQLLEAYTPAPRLTFDLVPETGKYLCKENGKFMSKEEIESLEGYQFNLELISERSQVTGVGNKLPNGIELIPYSREQYLNSLLKNPDDKYLTKEEAQQLLQDLNEGNWEKIDCR
ncbi:MAG: hypothetical protein WCS03_09465 [Bacteroidota bacterium]